MSTYRDGWGVYVEPIWGHQTHYEDTGEKIPDPYIYEPNHVENIIVLVVRLSPATEAYNRPGCFEPTSGFVIPGACFEELENLWADDTHDLRPRWYQSEREARDHADYTLRR